MVGNALMYTILLKFRDRRTIMNVSCSNELATYSISDPRDPFHRNYSQNNARYKRTYEYMDEEADNNNKKKIQQQ